MLQLLKESGYVADPEEVTAEDLEPYLRQHPDLIDTWLFNSMDTRGTPTWFLQSPEESPKGKRWVVGLFPGEQHWEFEQGSEASAYYLKQFAESIRASLKSSPP